MFVLNIILLLMPETKMSDAIIVKQFNSVLVIQFNRPKIRSPLSIFVLEELIAILDKCSQNVTIEQIIFTGREDVFASGADLREIAEVTKETAREFAARGQNLMNKIAHAKPKTIAAINGFCFGGALDLALACNERIASPNALFSHPGANLGIITGWGGTQRLPRLIGEAKALEMFLTAKRVGVIEALQIGLVDKIADDPLEYSIAN
jgi:enoyl-CoA hydratase